MGARHPDYRRIKKRRSYTIAEVTSLFDIHQNTLRNWRRQGLQPIDDRRPVLFHGASLRSFLQARRASAKQPCGQGRIYCLPCHAPKEPAGGMVDYQPITSASGRLVGLCPDCSRLMFRRVSLGQLHAVTAGLDVQSPQAQPSLGEG